MTGRVTLVGGGPGAADLITVRGLDRLQEADVVIYDRLAPVALLDRLRDGVELIDAARSPNRRILTYEQIADLMVHRAREGKHVVRLKGGDPFVFAHGAQELESCASAGIPVEVVPGVTSATAAPALAGLALTATTGAVGFTVVSGHLDPGDSASRLDWTAVARAGTAVVILMGMRNLRAIAARLIADGIPPGTGASCIADASLDTQRVVRSTLEALADDVEAAALANPAVIVIDGGRRGTLERVLVVGTARSGKSGFAERLLASSDPVTYVATAAPRLEDPEWSARIARHRSRRPEHWDTIETGDVAELLRTGADRSLLVDSATAWLERTMDVCGCWSDDDPAGAQKRLREHIDSFVDSWQHAIRTVLVTDEVGGGIVPASPSGRLFRDVLGELNQRLAAAADSVYEVVAGIPRRLR